MDEMSKTLLPMVDRFCAINGYKRGRTLTLAQKCYTEGRKAGERDQRLRDHKSARWEIIGGISATAYWAQGVAIHRVKCGRCHAESVKVGKNPLNYCPHCGAIMDAEQGHGCMPGGAE